MTVGIVGIDCATDRKNVGLARGFLSGNRLVVDRLAKPEKDVSIASLVSGWIGDFEKTLLAIDAPLGWPASMGRQLAGHCAGGVIEADPNRLFRRETDRFVKSKTGKQSLDVGADRIARTALAALELLRGIGKETGEPVPLAWRADLIAPVSAIEVYPAATLKVLACRNSGYKLRQHEAERREIIEALADEIRFEADASMMIGDDDVLDAAVCVLAGGHFLRGQCYPPTDTESAEKEGWIWVRSAAKIN